MQVRESGVPDSYHRMPTMEVPSIPLLKERDGPPVVSCSMQVPWKQVWTHTKAVNRTSHTVRWVKPLFGVKLGKVNKRSFCRGRVGVVAAEVRYGVSWLDKPHHTQNYKLSNARSLPLTYNTQPTKYPTNHATPPLPPTRTDEQQTADQPKNTAPAKRPSWHHTNTYKNEGQKRSGFRGRPPQSPLDGHVGASTLDLQGLTFPWAAISSRTWKARIDHAFSHLFAEAPQKCLNERSLFWGDLTSKPGVMRQRNGRAKWRSS